MYYVEYELQSMAIDYGLIDYWLLVMATTMKHQVEGNDDGIQGYSLFNHV